MDIENQLEGIRARYVEMLWRALLVLILIAGPLSISRVSFTGWRPIYAFQLATMLVVIGIFLYRKRISTSLLALILVSITFVLGTVGVYSFGLIGGHYFWFYIGCQIAILSLSKREFIVCSFISTVIFFTVAYLYISGSQVVNFDQNAYVSSVVAWGTIFICVAVLGAANAVGIKAKDTATASLLETIKKQRDEIEFLATHDALTGLPQSALAMDRLHVAIAHAKRDAKQVAMMFIDLDGFKAVNDTFGHDAGDAVLLEIAKRLKASVREGDTVGRIAGDEFVVIAAGVQDRAAAQLVAEKLIEAVSLPILWGDSMLQVGASIGVSLYPEHGESGPVLRSKADHAMYQVKRSGKNGVAFA